MADTFKFELVSPERLLISEDVEQVVVPGSEGDFAILPGHAPILSTLRPGVLDVSSSQSEDKTIFVRGGFAEGGPESLTVLAQEAIAVEDMTPEDLNRQISEAEEALARDNITDEERRYNETALQALSDLKK